MQAEAENERIRSGLSRFGFASTILTAGLGGANPKVKGVTLGV